jgi:hypothetical protein
LVGLALAGYREASEPSGDPSILAEIEAALMEGPIKKVYVSGSQAMAEGLSLPDYDQRTSELIKGGKAAVLKFLREQGRFTIEG